jgi:phage terminase Nu1 subunit (DNA packaging protein)
MGMNIKRYAERRRALGLWGGTRQAVYAAVQRGAIELLPDGTVDADRADHAWKTEREGRRSGTMDAAEKSADYNRERALREKANRELTELKLAQARGDSVDAQTAARDWYAAARTARDLLLGIPTECASELASMRDAHAVEMLLTARIVAALETLSSPPSGESDDDGDLEEDDTGESEAG